MLSLDNYNDASRLIDGNFDDPRLTDYELLLENLRDLKEGKDIQASCCFQRLHASGAGGLLPPRITSCRWRHCATTSKLRTFPQAASLTSGVFPAPDVWMSILAPPSIAGRPHRDCFLAGPHLRLQGQQARGVQDCQGAGVSRSHRGGHLCPISAHQVWHLQLLPATTPYIGPFA